MFEAKYSATPL